MSRFEDAIKHMKKKMDETGKKVGFFLEAEAKLRAPVKTGELRRDITSEVESEGQTTTVFIGNTEHIPYAAVIENGSIAKNIQAQPYIRPSIEENVGELQQIIKEELSK